MIPKPLAGIVEADIDQLKAAGIQEGKTLEYKKELPSTRDEDKREFLADISSFANTEGGDIVYGVEEDQGVITNIVGATCPDSDAETLRLENLVRDGIAPRITIRRSGDNLHSREIAYRSGREKLGGTASRDISWP